MGLDLSVGYLADLIAHDPEGASEVSGDFENLNVALGAAGLSPHREPRELSPDDQFSCQMWGYSGLHYLRRVAAFDAFGYDLPEPGGDGASEDPLVARYYYEFTKRPGLLQQLFKQPAEPLPFQHLIVHSDAEGYYVPQDFESVIFPEETLEIPGGMVGSTQRLTHECRRLAKLLQIPDHLEPEAEEVWEAADDPGSGASRWQRYGVETFCCTRLLRACEVSLRTGAAIVFC